MLLAQLDWRPTPPRLELTSELRTALLLIELDVLAALLVPWKLELAPPRLEQVGKLDSWSG